MLALAFRAGCGKPNRAPACHEGDFATKGRDFDHMEFIRPFQFITPIISITSISLLPFFSVSINYCITLSSYYGRS